jgi:uncharacterized membrane protein YeaQ/YmgE (transglycosylase-associated protein family)
MEILLCSRTGSEPVIVHKRGTKMDITSLIIQLIVGAIGGNAAGKAMPEKSLGTLGNTIAGVIGGVGGGQLLDMILGGAAMPVDATAAAGGMDIGAIIQDIAGGGIGGAVLMVVVAIVKGMMNKS